MNKKTVMLFFTVVIMAGCATTNHTINTKQRSVQGGIIGSSIGGIVGHQSGRGLEGAAIGSLIGAAAGAVWGSSEDEILDIQSTRRVESVRAPESQGFAKSSSSTQNGSRRVITTTTTVTEYE